MGNATGTCTISRSQGILRRVCGSAWSLLCLVIISLVMCGCTSRADKNLQARVRQAEQNIYLTAACIEDFYDATDQHIYLGGFLLSEPADIQGVWGLTDAQIAATTDSQFLVLHFMRDFDQLGDGLNSPRLPAPELQVLSRRDPFSTMGALLAYAGHKESHWYLLSSVGPDGVRDLPFRNIDPRPYSYYRGNRTLTGDPIIAYQYDPTNGIASRGDLIFWRDARYNNDLAFRTFLPYGGKPFKATDMRLWELR
jgi:hypothetical protein